jgi:tRNA (guanine37-N1)-methyltransferase
MGILKKRLKNRLSEFVSSEELTYIYNSYDVIGDIAIIRVTERSRKFSRIIAETIMNVQRNVKTVLAQTSSVRGDLRLRKLDFVAGQNKTTTIHKESGCSSLLMCKNAIFHPDFFTSEYEMQNKLETEKLL